MDNSLKTKDLLKTTAERGKREGNKTPLKTPDSLRQGASQATDAASYAALRPLRVTAPPRLQLKAAGMTERFPFGPSTRPENPPFPS